MSTRAEGFFIQKSAVHLSVICGLFLLRRLVGVPGLAESLERQPECGAGTVRPDLYPAKTSVLIEQGVTEVGRQRSELRAPKQQSP